MTPRAGALLCPMLLTGAAAAGMAWAVRGRSSEAFGPSLWRGRPGRKAIALTFDDGPSPATPRILDILAGYSVPATFFQCGENVLRVPELSQAVCAGPHEIGNHSHTHRNFALKRPSDIVDDFACAQNAISEATSRTPVLMRPPYGVRWFGVEQAQRRLGLTGAMWTVIGRDWKLPADGIAKRVLNNAANGGVVCLHDGRGVRTTPNIQPTLEAVEYIIPRLQERGFEFLTLSQVLCPKS